MALDPSTEPSILRALWFPLCDPKTPQCPISAQSAGEPGRSQGQETGSHRPRVTGALRDDPAPISIRTHRPTLTAGFITVANSHRT